MCAANDTRRVIKLTSWIAKSKRENKGNDTLFIGLSCSVFFIFTDNVNTCVKKSRQKSNGRTANLSSYLLCSQNGTFLLLFTAHCSTQLCYNFAVAETKWNTQTAGWIPPLRKNPPIPWTYRHLEGETIIILLYHTFTHRKLFTVTNHHLCCWEKEVCITGLQWIVVTVQSTCNFSFTKRWIASIRTRRTLSPTK